MEVRVLVVDDEPLIRSAICRLATGLGFLVDQAKDGDEARRMIAEVDFDAVISDINMPGMGGMDLLRHINQEHPGTPVILLTGFPALDTAIRAVDCGAFQYLVKPFAKEEMKKVLQRAVGARQMARLQREALALGAEEARGSGGTEALNAAFDRTLASLLVAFQPIFEASTGRIHGVEALMRPGGEDGLNHPFAVLTAGERLGRLPELGRRIRSLGLAPMEEESEHVRLFLNLHPSDLLDEELYDSSSPLAARADRIVLEVTERASLERIGGLQARIQRLREIGYRLAVDDLGAGYAGLSSFATLSPEYVKIDMSLVREVDRSPLKQRLVRSMAEVCRDLGILVVAEGIETVGERDCVVELGCQLLQGYLLGRPRIRG